MRRASPVSFAEIVKPISGMLTNAAMHEYWWIRPLSSSGCSG